MSAEFPYIVLKRHYEYTAYDSIIPVPTVPPFAKSLRKDRYYGSVLATTKVLVQDFVHNLNCKSCPGTFVATKGPATVPVFPQRLCERGCTVD